MTSSIVSSVVKIGFFGMMIIGLMNTLSVQQEQASIAMPGLYQVAAR